MDTVQLQDSILAAIDSLASNRIDKIQADKTITAQISKCSNALTGEYRVSYNGGTIIAYAPEGTTYTEGNQVYVLVPQGDFTKRKTIVGLAQAKDEDENISFVSTALSDYNIIGKNCLEVDSTKSFGLHSYLKTEYDVLYSASGDVENKIGVNLEELENDIRESEAVMVQASFKTRLPKTHRKTISGEFGLSISLVFADRDKTDENGNPTEKTYTYVIDTNNMSGNPFNSSDWSSQYQIYPIDVDNFIRIENVVFYERNFVDKDDRTNADMYGADIFVKNVQFYSLKKITATNGEFKLSISTPDGTTLSSLTDSSKLGVRAKVVQKSTDLSDNTTFYWFKEDNRVTSESSTYQMYGGNGWSWLKDKGANYSISVYGNENKAYENIYMLVAVYKESVILKEKFTIYNKAAKRDISIESSLGVKFSFDRGEPVLTCLINGNERDFDKDATVKHDDSLFRFVWSKEDKYGNVTVFNQTKAELQKQYDELYKQYANGKEGVTMSMLLAAKNSITALTGVSWTKNKLTYPVASIVDGIATFKCSVYLRDHESDKSDDEYNIGSATIVLQNESVASPTDYHIEIENGDQVFQYSESGVSPDDERYENPLEIKSLVCHFYDPAGLEVNKDTYTVNWIVPIEDTMITTPSAGMIVNNANGKKEIYTEAIYPLAIDGNYDYFATSNQVRAIVSYGGQEYSQYSSLTFTKIGENGTNGTDMVAKITDLYKSNDDTMSAIVYYGNIDGNGAEVKWEDAESHPLSDKKFSLDLFQRNEKIAIDETKVKWTTAGGSGSNSKYMSVVGGSVSWSSSNAKKGKYRNQIVKASVNYEDNDYYAFKTIPYIRYPKLSKSKADSVLKIKISDSKTLKTILYNADGRNPLYNKNQGISITINGSSSTGLYLVWTVEGGEPRKIAGEYEDHPMLSPDFSLIYEKNSGKRSLSTSPLTPRYIDAVLDEDGNIVTAGHYESLTTVYVLPNDTCSGEYCNNIARCRIYESKEIYDAENSNTSKDELYMAEVCVPIFMSLNTYGLKSLNAWDGTHIEINEDDNYILAPQIGAGVKDSSNKFTGLVMGRAKFYDSTASDGRVEANDSIGLLGYSGGRQSIFLNAEDGSATFGLPEEDASRGVSPTYTQGQIKLVPNGVSKIGGWRIGSRTLYNISQDTTIHDEEQDLTKPYSDLSKKDSDGNNIYKSSLPHDSEGIMLSAEPAYMSIKGRRLLAESKDADFSQANTVVQPQDSFELEMNPNDPSIFTVFRHTASPKEILYKVVGTGEDAKIVRESDETSVMSVAKCDDSGKIIGWTPLEKNNEFDANGYVIARRLYDFDAKAYSGNYYFSIVDSNVDENGNRLTYYIPEELSDNTTKTAAEKMLFEHFVWHREAKVGINTQGRFYTNALKDSSTSLTIGNLGAYGKNANAHAYVGATFEIGLEDNSNSLIKFFTDQEKIDSKSGTLYLSGGSDTNNEYARPLHMAFKNLDIYTSETNSSNTSSNNRIRLSNSMFDAGIKNSHLTLYNTQDESNDDSSKNTPIGSLNSWSGLSVICGNDGNRDFNVKARNISNQAIGSTSITSKDSYTINTSSSFKVSSSMSDDGAHIELSDNSKGIRISNGEILSYVNNGSNMVGEIRSGTDGVTSINSNIVNVTSNGTGINIRSNNNGVVDIRACPNNGGDVSLVLTPQNGDSAATWWLKSTNGNLNSSPEAYSTWRGLSTEDFMRAKAFIATGQLNHADDDIGKYGIYSHFKIGTNSEIHAVGNMSGSNFIFNNDTGHGNNLITIINDLYDKVAAAQSKAQQGVDDAAKAQKTANFANTNANSRVLKSTYNSHYHSGATINFESTIVDGKNVVTSICGNKNGTAVIRDIYGVNPRV